MGYYIRNTKNLLLFEEGDLCYFAHHFARLQDAVGCDRSRDEDEAVDTAVKPFLAEPRRKFTLCDFYFDIEAYKVLIFHIVIMLLGC